MRSKLYTKTGDKGTTRLVDGSCVEKFNPRVEAYGTVDELNSQLGEVRLRLRDDRWLSALEPFFETVQNRLFNLGSLLACEKTEVLDKLPPVTDAHVGELETKIDELDGLVPPLNQFILPAGHGAAVALHVARTICRRAERRTAELESADPRHGRALVYLNRLSDLLFVAARWANHQTGTAEALWKDR